MRINLTKEECYTDIVSFYDVISKKLGLKLGKDAQFDCRKINVTKAVQDEIMRYYKEEKYLTTSALVMLMVCYAPKADLKPEEDFFVELDDGFVIKKEGATMDGD